MEMIILIWTTLEWHRWKRMQKIWIKSTHDNKCFELIIVRCVLKPTASENLHFSLTRLNEDIINFSLQIFAWTYQTIINMLHVLSRVMVLFICKDIVKSLNHSSSTVSLVQCARFEFEWQLIRFPVEIYISFFAFLSFLTARRSTYKWKQVWHSSRVERERLNTAK